MKYTKGQIGYLEAIHKCDWKQRNRYGIPKVRKWANDNTLVEYGTKGGQRPMYLTEAGRKILESVKAKAKLELFDREISKASKKQSEDPACALLERALCLLIKVKSTNKDLMPLVREIKMYLGKEV